jgi:hypothetical protein
MVTRFLSDLSELWTDGSYNVAHLGPIKVQKI